MSPASQQPVKYRDLKLQEGHIAGAPEGFDHVYVGQKSPSLGELKSIADEFADNASELHIGYVGLTKVAGAPTSGDSQFNGIILLFWEKHYFNTFLNHDISPSARGVSLILQVTVPPRLL
jgi:hypothetical protein